MLRLKQHTTPLPFDGTFTLPERLVQISRLSKGRLQLGVLVFGRLLSRLVATGLVLMGPLSHGSLLPQAIHLSLEPALVVGQLVALLVCLNQGLLRLHHLGGLRLKELHLCLETALVTRQLLMQPVGLIKRPSGRGRHCPRVRHLDAKTAGVGNEPVIVMTGPEQTSPLGQHLGYKEQGFSRREKDKT